MVRKISRCLGGKFKDEKKRCDSSCFVFVGIRIEGEDYISGHLNRILHDYKWREG